MKLFRETSIVREFFNKVTEALVLNDSSSNAVNALIEIGKSYKAEYYVGKKHLSHAQEGVSPLVEFSFGVAEDDELYDIEGEFYYDEVEESAKYYVAAINKNDSVIAFERESDSFDPDYTIGLAELLFNVCEYTKRREVEEVKNYEYLMKRYAEMLQDYVKFKSDERLTVVLDYLKELKEVPKEVARYRVCHKKWWADTIYPTV